MEPPYGQKLDSNHSDLKSEGASCTGSIGASLYQPTAFSSPLTGINTTRVHQANQSSSLNFLLQQSIEQMQGDALSKLTPFMWGEFRHEGEALQDRVFQTFESLKGQLSFSELRDVQTQLSDLLESISQLQNRTESTTPPLPISGCASLFLNLPTSNSSKASISLDANFRVKHVLGYPLEMDVLDETPLFPEIITQQRVPHVMMKQCINLFRAFTQASPTCQHKALVALLSEIHQISFPDNEDFKTIDDASEHFSTFKFNSRGSSSSSLASSSQQGQRILIPVATQFRALHISDVSITSMEKKLLACPPSEVQTSNQTSAVRAYHIKYRDLLRAMYRQHMSKSLYTVLTAALHFDFTEESATFRACLNAIKNEISLATVNATVQRQEFSPVPVGVSLTTDLLLANFLFPGFTLGDNLLMKIRCQLNQRPTYNPMFAAELSHFFLSMYPEPTEDIENHVKRVTSAGLEAQQYTLPFDFDWESIGLITDSKTGQPLLFSQEVICKLLMLMYGSTVTCESNRKSGFETQFESHVLNKKLVSLLDTPEKRFNFNGSLFWDELLSNLTRSPKKSKRLSLEKITRLLASVSEVAAVPLPPTRGRKVQATTKRDLISEDLESDSYSHPKSKNKRRRSSTSRYSETYVRVNSTTLHTDGFDDQINNEQPIIDQGSAHDSNYIHNESAGGISSSHDTYDQNRETDDSEDEDDRFCRRSRVYSSDIDEELTNYDTNHMITFNQEMAQGIPHFNNNDQAVSTYVSTLHQLAEIWSARENTQKDLDYLLSIFNTVLPPKMLPSDLFEIDEAGYPKLPLVPVNGMSETNKNPWCHIWCMGSRQLHEELFPRCLTPVLLALREAFGYYKRVPMAFRERRKREVSGKEERLLKSMSVYAGNGFGKHAREACLARDYEIRNQKRT